MPARPLSPGIALFGVLCLWTAHVASAHELVGNRFFPATLAIDDPGVNDELSVPTVSAFRTGDEPPSRRRDFSAEFSKRITESFAISVGTTYSQLGLPGPPGSAHGFQNLETTFKYRVYRNIEHEFVLSAGLNVEWGGTGSGEVGADPFNTYTPTLYFGKGLGDLPDSMSWLRPFAITGQVGYAVPARRASEIASIDPDTGLASTDLEIHPDVLLWGGTIQYSLPYLKASVIDLGLPDFINHLVPIVEANFATPVSHVVTSGTGTLGTVNPGVIYVGRFYQVALEAILPINARSGHGVGIIGQLHFYLDDIAPDWIGRPIFASHQMVGPGGH